MIRLITLTLPSTVLRYGLSGSHIMLFLPISCSARVPETAAAIILQCKMLDMKGALSLQAHDTGEGDQLRSFLVQLALHQISPCRWVPAQQPSQCVAVARNASVSFLQ